MPRSQRNGPPPLTNLYPAITSFAALHAVALRAQKGKRFRPAVLAFHEHLEAHLFQLRHELQSFSYRPGPYRQFEIRDPKRRLISAAPCGCSTASSPTAPAAARPSMPSLAIPC